MRHDTKVAMDIAIANINQAERSLILFGESLRRVNFPFENIPLSLLDCQNDADNVLILKEPNNKPYYRKFEKPLRGLK